MRERSPSDVAELPEAGPVMPVCLAGCLDRPSHFLDGKDILAGRSQDGNGLLFAKLDSITGVNTGCSYLLPCPCRHYIIM